MAWSEALKAKLASGGYSSAIWLLDVFAAYQEPSGGAYTVSSARGYGEDEVLLAADGPTITGARLTPVSWSSTVGAFTIDLAGDPRTFFQHVTRGTVMRLRIGFPGWVAALPDAAHPEFELVAWGMLNNWRGKGTRWTLDFRDPLACLGNRLALTNVSLFAANAATTTLTAAFNAGDVTATVASTSGFDYDTAGAVIGIIRIESEFITYTGQTGTTFTGCTRGALGTTDTTHANGTTVNEMALLRGHPLDIVRRLLTSRGVTGNGTYDHYPATWGIGLTASLMDNDDIAKWKAKAIKVASGSYQWDVAVEGAWVDPGSEITSRLSSAALYCTVRQGLITCRGATPPQDTDPAYLSEYAIVDEDIIGGWDGVSVEGFASEQSVEYSRVTAYTATANSNSTDAVQTLPATHNYDYDCTDKVFTNETAVRTELLGRTVLIAGRIPEALDLTMAGMRFAALTPGDVVTVTSDRLVSRFGDTYVKSATGRLAMVVQVSPDWPRNVVRLRLLSYPVTTGVFE